MGTGLNCASITVWAIERYDISVLGMRVAFCPLCVGRRRTAKRWVAGPCKLTE